VTAASVARFWGSTATERERPYPCDRHLPGASEALFRAVDVEAPPGTVFRWLCQLRAAPYSYDWIDHWGRRSPTTLTPGLDDLEVGQRLMMLFELVEFERDRHLTVLLKAPSATVALFGRMAASYVVVPRRDGGSRLIVKLTVRYPPGPLGWTVRWLMPWADLVMMRKQLLTLKRLAESCNLPPP
jgi:hypothetical protein